MPRLILVLAHLAGLALMGIDPGGRLPNPGWEVRLNIVEAQAEDELQGGFRILVGGLVEVARTRLRCFYPSAYSYAAGLRGYTRPSQ